MSWSKIVGHEQIKARLKAALMQQRLAPAWIFAGPAGVGKRLCAITLAKASNCERADGDSCGRCAACYKIAAGDHLDVKFVAPDGAFIKVAQVRQLVEEAQYRPFEGRRRVFIIDPADTMNETAANALLKTLEEPSQDALLVLITDKLHALLPTIRSRCQIQLFAPLKTEEVEAFLRRFDGRAEADIRLTARLAAGCIGRALDVDLVVYREQRKETIELLKLLGTSTQRARLLRAAEYLGRKLSRDEFQQRLTIVYLILRDLFHLLVEGPTADLVNGDIVTTLQQLAKQWSLDRIEQFTAHLETLQRNLQQNINRQLALEEIFLVQMA